jgi:hypothetical protein
MRFPYDVSLRDFMPFVPCSKHDCIHIVGGYGWLQVVMCASCAVSCWVMIVGCVVGRRG